jgi:hypothetical protein
MERSAFHSWLAGSNSTTPPLSFGSRDSVLLNSSADFELPGATPQDLDMTELQPSNQISDGLGAMMQWSNNQNLNSSSRSLTDEPIQEEDLFWLEQQPSSTADLLQADRQRFSAAASNSPDTLLKYSGALNKTSSLILASWRAVKGMA